MYGRQSSHYAERTPSASALITAADGGICFGRRHKRSPKTCESHEQPPLVCCLSQRKPPSSYPHLIAYSTNPNEGYLSEKGVMALRSYFAKDILLGLALRI